MSFKTPLIIDRIAGLSADNRFDLWKKILDLVRPAHMLEIGVWKGEFAAAMLHHGGSIVRYTMLDPWRHLQNWNKPFNLVQDEFDKIYASAMSLTASDEARRRILRGTTLEMIDFITDGELDVAYVDGDHTLRGITIDLVRSYPKLRPGGILGGDDFSASIWQHGADHEPTLVSPFAVYFAESQAAPIVLLPFDQFIIVKPSTGDGHFRIVDARSAKTDLSLRSRLDRPVG